MRSAERTTEIKRRFYLNFGFMHASTSNFNQPNKAQDRVVHTYNGYSSYLLIVDKASRHVWAFLTKSKEPPLDIVEAFLERHGHSNGRCLCTDQGGELARSSHLLDMVLRKYHYVMEPTGADSPSQNGAVEIYNDNWRFVHVRSCVDQVCLPNIGRLRFCIQCILLIVWCIL